MKRSETCHDEKRVVQCISKPTIQATGAVQAQGAVGVGAHLPAHGVGVDVCVGVALGVGVAVGVAIAVGVGVGIGPPDCAQYLPSVLVSFNPCWLPQMIISVPVPTAV